MLKNQWLFSRWCFVWHKRAVTNPIDLHHRKLQWIGSVHPPADKHKANSATKNLNNIHIFLLFVSSVSSCKRRQGRRNPLPLFLFTLISGRKRYKKVWLCGLRPQNGRGLTPPLSYIFQKSRVALWPPVTFFLSTPFYKIPYQFMGDFAKGCRFISMKFSSARLHQQKIGKIYNLPGNGPGAVARPLGNLNRTHPL